MTVKLKFDSPDDRAKILRYIRTKTSPNCYTSYTVDEIISPGYYSYNIIINSIDIKTLEKIRQIRLSKEPASVAVSKSTCVQKSNNMTKAAPKKATTKKVAPKKVTPKKVITTEKKIELLKKEVSKEKKKITILNRKLKAKTKKLSKIRRTSNQKRRKRTPKK